MVIMGEKHFVPGLWVIMRQNSMLHFGGCFQNSARNDSSRSLCEWSMTNVCSVRSGRTAQGNLYFAQLLSRRFVWIWNLPSVYLWRSHTVCGGSSYCSSSPVYHSKAPLWSPLLLKPRCTNTDRVEESEVRLILQVSPGILCPAPCRVDVTVYLDNGSSSE